LKKNVKAQKNVNILETAKNITKSSKFRSRTLLSGVLQGMIIAFKLLRD